MPQGALSFQYELNQQPANTTARGGLPLYLELAHVSGLVESIRSRLTVRDGDQGWSDVQVVLSLVLLNLAGGEVVDDLDVLEKDGGFSAILRRAELQHLSRPQRRDLERRWRKERKRAVPSPSAVRRYLEKFHDPAQETLRSDGKAFIPTPNEHLTALKDVHRAFLAFVQRRSPQTQATVDMDATLIPTHKAEALFCYKHFRAYQPLNAWWAEQGMFLHTEFRDGNVPAGFEILRVLEDSLDMLPAGVQKVRVRSDTAGYDHDFLAYMADGLNPRFGVIEFAVGCDVTPELKRAIAEVKDADWELQYTGEGKERIATKREWAEVCFVPNKRGHSKKKEAYRYIATRELLEQPLLPGLEDQQKLPDLHKLPFQTMTWDTRRYKIHALVTNFERAVGPDEKPIPGGWDGETVINWLYERCGKSEEAHSVIKEDLAGGKLPSRLFGANAAWWWSAILAHNLDAAMKRLVLGDGWATKRLKAIRFHLINLAGLLRHGGRQLRIRLSCGLEKLELILGARRTLAAMAGAASPG